MTAQLQNIIEQAGAIALLMGGESAEREVSLRSGQAVYEALHAQGFNVTAIDFRQPQQLVDIMGQFQRVFIALHGRGGEDGRLQGALETLKLPYTGCGVLASAIAMDKFKTKQIWQSQQLPTPQYAVLNQVATLDDAATLLHKLGGKVMVKPACEGSSIGMAQVTEPDVLVEAVAHALKFDNEILVEQWIEGEEYTVAILKQKALPAIRLKTPNKFYDYQAKYQSNTTEYLCPCGLSEAEEHKLQALALQAFKAINGQGWGRVDVMRDSQTGQFYLLEVNTVPGMTSKSLVPMAAKQAGLSFEQLVVEILTTSMES